MRWMTCLLALAFATVASAASLNFPDDNTLAATQSPAAVNSLQTNALTLALGDTVHFHVAGWCEQTTNIGIATAYVQINAGIANLASDGREGLLLHLGSSGTALYFDYDMNQTVVNDATSGTIAWSEHLVGDPTYPVDLFSGTQSFNTPTSVAGLITLKGYTSPGTTASIRCAVQQASATPGSTSWSSVN